MKTKINAILLICIAALIYICFDSITGPVMFQKERNLRETIIKERLTYIRTAEELWRDNHNGRYTASWDSLTQFIKYGEAKTVVKNGQISEAQMAQGIDEAKAVELGIIHRDTVVRRISTLFRKAGNIDSLRFIPFSEGEEFTLQTNQMPDKSGTIISMFECSAPLAKYMSDFETIRIKEAELSAEENNKYAGLKVGSIITPNNNAGSWE